MINKTKPGKLLCCNGLKKDKLAQKVKKKHTKEDHRTKESGQFNKKHRSVSGAECGQEPLIMQVTNCSHVDQLCIT